MRLFKAGVTEKQHKDAVECSQFQLVQFRLGVFIFNKMFFFIRAISRLLIL